MLRLFDPTLENQPSPNEEELNLIPIYRNPKIQAASLPGKGLDQHIRYILVHTYLNSDMGFPTMWYFDKCSFRQALEAANYVRTVAKHP